MSEGVDYSRHAMNASANLPCDCQGLFIFAIQRLDAQDARGDVAMAPAMLGIMPKIPCSVCSDGLDSGGTGPSQVPRRFLSNHVGPEASLLVKA